MSHSKQRTVEYQRHVAEEIEQFSALLREGEGRETLQQPIPASWKEAERRAAMVMHKQTGDFPNAY